MPSSPDIAIVLGTRPEIIKLAPVIRECDRRDLSLSLIHTGQHYSDELDAVFFDQLELPTPDHELAVGSDTHGAQTGEMLGDIEAILLEIDPDIVLVQGDTNSVLAGAIATSKLPIALGHIEAGLRSFDRDMPEENNRVLTDHVADYLFAPTSISQEHLVDEGIDPDRIFVTGNTIVDAVHQHQGLATEKSAVHSTLSLEDRDYALLTAHRAENVDDRDRFGGLLDGVARAADALDIEVVYPIHPRAENRLAEFDLSVPDAIRVVDPLDYLDFLALETDAELVFTDSGGVQEEACILSVPCVTLRSSTERPETIDVGANRLVGTDPMRIQDGAAAMDETEPDWENPFGDGTAAARIVDVLLERMPTDIRNQ